MTWRSVGLLGLLAVGTAGRICAADYPAPDPREGQALAEAIRTAAPAESSEYRGSLQIRKLDAELVSVPFTCRILAGAPVWQVIYETQATAHAPAERLIIVRTTNGPNQYLHAQAAAPDQPVGELRPLPPDQLARPLAGSAFWLLDLGLEFFHWPTQRLLKTEMRKGRVCRVLESVPAAPLPDGYGRVLSWIDVETGGLVLAEGYDPQGRLIKEFSIRSFRKVGGRWELEEMEMRDLRRRCRTRLEFDLARSPGG